MNPELRKALVAAKYRWPLFARPSQLPPKGDWRGWLIMTGRGWGKNRTAAELVRSWAESGKYPRINLVAATADDARETMIEGELSGLLAVCPPWNMPEYEPSKKRLTWANGTRVRAFSAEAPERFRGPQCYKYWADELAAWKYQQQTWDMLQFGARLGDSVQGIVTSTPKPGPLLKALMSRKGWVLTRGSTEENRANLSEEQYEDWVVQYGGTRLGRQEMAGEYLDDNPDALWLREWIDASRVFEAPKLLEVVVAVDPSATATGDEAGIIAAGRSADQLTEIDGAMYMAPHFYVLQDATLRGRPIEWAKEALAAYHGRRANCIVYESNTGGQMVEDIFAQLTAGVPIVGVPATDSKGTRAEPVATMAEQGRIHHVGNLPDLEAELCEWIPPAKGTRSNAPSPNRLDALVWAISHLARLGGRHIQTSTRVIDYTEELDADILPDIGGY